MRECETAMQMLYIFWSDSEFAVVKLKEVMGVGAPLE
jgi:hypothetical protein